MRRWWITFLGFVRRELRTTLSEPLLLIVLVLGPFGILLLFGGGYRNETISLRTLFVAPENERLREEIVAGQDEFADYVVPVGFTDDLFDARRQLGEGVIDLVVVFPSDPETSIRAGEQVEIAVLHSKIDPIQIAAVDIASEVAVQQINASIVIEIVELGQAEVDREGERVDQLLVLSDRLSATADDATPEEIVTLSDDLDAALASAALSAEASTRLLGVFSTDAETEAEREQLESLQRDVDRSREILAQIRRDPAAQNVPERLLTLNELLQTLADPLADLRSVPAEVLVKPFSHDAESIIGRAIGPVDFFVPSAVALLVQHAGLTFSALTIVRDRNLRLVEHYRVGSVPPSAILLGKAFAFISIGGVLSALLLALVDVALGVEVAGSYLMAGVVLLLLLAASVATGLFFSLVASSDTQAVQLAMLTLLASIFFGGFFLSLDALRYPFKAVAWLLPVTYGIRGLQDVMLRGENLGVTDALGLGAIALVGGVASLVVWRRSLRPV